MRMIKILVSANSVHPPHSQISTRIWSLSWFHKFFEIRACGLQHRAGLRGATGAIAPGPPLKGGPRDDIYLFYMKHSFEKLS